MDWLRSGLLCTTDFFVCPVFQRNVIFFISAKGFVNTFIKAVYHFGYLLLDFFRKKTPSLQIHNCKVHKKTVFPTNDIFHTSWLISIDFKLCAMNVSVPSVREDTTIIISVATSLLPYEAHNLYIGVKSQLLWTQKKRPLSL